MTTTMEDQNFCFICLNGLDLDLDGVIKNEVIEEQPDHNHKSNPTIPPSPKDHDLPRNVDFICDLLGLQDGHNGMDQRKWNNLVPPSCRTVNYCVPCSQILLGLKDLLAQLAALTKRVDELKESISQLFVNAAVPKEKDKEAISISRWTNKLRSFLIQVISKKSKPNAATMTTMTKRIAPNPEPPGQYTISPSCPGTGASSITLPVLELVNDETVLAESPNSDPDWFPELEFQEPIQNDHDIDDRMSLSHEPLDTDTDPMEFAMAIKPCSVKLTRLGSTRTIPSKYILPKESLRKKQLRKRPPEDKIYLRNGKILEKSPQKTTKSFKQIVSKMYKCIICFQQFSTHKELRTHRLELKHLKKIPKYKLLPTKSKRTTFKGKRINCPFTNCNVSCSATYRESLNGHIAKVHEGKDKPYTCKICSEEFSKLLHLRKHQVQLKHRRDYQKQQEPKKSKVKSKSILYPENRLLCPYCNCNRSFSPENPIRLSYHIRKFHEGHPKPFNCSYCPEEFTTDCLLRKHKKEAKHTLKFCTPLEIEPQAQASLSPIPCTRANCSFEIREPEHLEFHVREVHDHHPKPYNCSKCPEEFSSFAQLEEHRAEVFQKKSNFAIQTTSNIDTDEFKCTCGRFFSVNYKLELHLARQGGSCKNATLNSYIDADSSSNKRFVCGVCSGKFRNRKLLATHLTTHSNNGNLRHICELCGTSFKSKQSLGYHKRQKHTEEYIQSHPQPEKAQEQLNQLTCEQCGKISSTPHVAKMHRLIHQESKFYSYCPEPECGRGFNSNSALAQHILTHKPKGFQCDQCGIEFTRKSGLNRHVDRVHQVNFKFVCQYCSKQFFDTYALKRHVLLVHEKSETEYQWHCLPCSKSFPTKSYLNIHQKTQRHKDMEKGAVNMM